MMNLKSMVNQKRLLDQFCQLVSIDSVSFQEDQMAMYLEKELQSLGCSVTRDQADEHYNSATGNLYTSIKGTIPGEPILFAAHMDTVVPGLHKKAIVHNDGTITSDGTTVLGADDLAAVAGILEAVKVIKEQNLPHRNIEIMFTIAEEVYNRGSEAADYEKIKAKQAYVFDLSAPMGHAALQAPTLICFTITVHGKAAHAGFAPEEGVHAILCASKAIAQIQMGHIDENTTVNIGSIEGGNATNIVPECCVVKGEVRSYSHEEAIAIFDQIKKTFADCASAMEATITVDSNFGCYAYQVDSNHPVVTRYDKVVSELGLTPVHTSTFGGSDNNNFLRHGITGIVAACGMHQVHSCQEYTTIEELCQVAEIMVGLMSSEE